MKSVGGSVLLLAMSLALTGCRTRPATEAAPAGRSPQPTASNEPPDASSKERAPSSPCVSCDRRFFAPQTSRDLPRAVPVRFAPCAGSVEPPRPSRSTRVARALNDLKATGVLFEQLTDLPTFVG